MVRTVLYGILLGVLGYALFLWRKMANEGFSTTQPAKKANQHFRVRNSREPWIQVYETASSDDAHLIQARLQEAELDCLIYEQGKKDIYGNSLKGNGIIVPKSAVPLAQKIISQMPV